MKIGIPIQILGKKWIPLWNNRYGHSLGQINIILASTRLWTYKSTRCDTTSFERKAKCEITLLASMLPYKYTLAGSIKQLKLLNTTLHNRQKVRKSTTKAAIQFNGCETTQDSNDDIFMDIIQLLVSRLNIHMNSKSDSWQGQ